MRLGLLVFIFIRCFSAIAQLPAECTTSVYKEVKHPYPWFDSLGVVSKETYYYRSGDLQYEYYHLFESQKEDSTLIYSYHFDSVMNKITTLGGAEFEEDFTTEYYLSESNSIYKAKYIDLSFIQNRFLRKNRRKEWYGIKLYSLDRNGTITSSKHRHYQESWKEWRKKGKRKDYRIDSSSYKEYFYNSLGLVDSSYNITIDDFSSDTTLIEIIRNEYSDAGQLTKKVKVYKSRNIYYPNQQYGMYWLFNIKTKKHKVKAYSNWNYVQKTNFVYSKNGNLQAVHAQVDSGITHSRIYEYTAFDSLVTISSVYDSDTTVEERLEYDSLNRLIYHFTTSRSDQNFVSDPRITYKRIQGGKREETKKYTYYEDGSYTVTLESNGGFFNSVDTTSSYYNAQNVLVKRTFSSGYFETYVFDKNQHLIAIERPDSSYTQFKYNDFGLLTEKRESSYEVDEDSIIRTFYKFKNKKGQR